MLGQFTAENQSHSITTDNAPSVVETINELNLVVQRALDHLEDGFKKIRFVSLKVCIKTIRILTR